MTTSTIPTTERPTLHQPNKFTGWCDTCKVVVRPGQGRLVEKQEGERWSVRCLDCCNAWYAQQAEAEDAWRAAQPPPTDRRFPWEEDGLTAEERLERLAAHDPIIRQLWEDLKRSRDSRAACYRLLGLTPPVTADEIKAAYRRKAKEAHPDRPGGSAERFREIQRAYEEAMRLAGGAA